MKKIADFLTESKNLKPVVFAFGRMNPPTTGHAKLVDKVHELAQQHGAHHEVVLSHSQDAKKNPLSTADKVKHAKRFFPNTNISASSKEHPNFIAHAKRLNQAGHKHLIMVAGSDRVKEYQDVLNKYNGKEFHFKKAEVVSAGERDPDAEGAEGMSASKMRAHATSGNFKEFKKGIPSHVSHAHAKELYHDVRKGSNLHEENKLLDKETATVAELASKHKVSAEEIEKQLAIGIKVEKEHTSDDAVAREIALDHIKEKPDYYTRLKKYVEETIKIGTVIGEGRVVSIRENSVVCNMHTGQMKTLSLQEALGLDTSEPKIFRRLRDLKVRNVAESTQINNTSGSDNMGKKMNENAVAVLEAQSEASGIPFDTLRQAYVAGVAAWRPGIRRGSTPQTYGLRNVMETITEYRIAPKSKSSALDELVEAHLFGTEGAKKAYSEMTPGQDGYTGADSSVGFDSATEHETPKKKKVKKEDREYDSRMGGAPAATGYGSSVSISVAEEALSKDPEIRAWALKESTQKLYVERYGADAAEKLVDAAGKMEKSMKGKSFSKFRKNEGTSGLGVGSDAGERITEESGHPYKMTYIKVNDNSRVKKHVTIHLQDKPRGPEHARALVSAHPQHKELRSQGYSIEKYGEHDHKTTHYGVPTKIEK